MSDRWDYDPWDPEHVDMEDHPTGWTCIWGLVVVLLGVAAGVVVLLLIF